MPFYSHAMAYKRPVYNGRRDSEPSRKGDITRKVRQSVNTICDGVRSSCGHLCIRTDDRLGSRWWHGVGWSRQVPFFFPPFEDEGRGKSRHVRDSHHRPGAPFHPFGCPCFRVFAPPIQRSWSSSCSGALRAFSSPSIRSFPRTLASLLVGNSDRFVARTVQLRLPHPSWFVEKDLRGEHVSRDRWGSSNGPPTTRLPAQREDSSLAVEDEVQK